MTRDTTKIMAAAQALVDYWRALPRHGSLPAKRELDPARIARGSLPYLFIYRRLDDGGFFCRLSGTALRIFHGRDVTGLALADFLAAEESTALAAAFQAVLDSGAPALESGAVSFADRTNAPYVRLLLPMSSDGHARDLVFGGLIFSGPDAPDPSR
jgi:hypothetical protein